MLPLIPFIQHSIENPSQRNLARKERKFIPNQKGSSKTHYWLLMYYALKFKDFTIDLLKPINNSAKFQERKLLLNSMNLNIKQKIQKSTIHKFYIESSYVLTMKFCTIHQRCEPSFCPAQPHYVSYLSSGPLVAVLVIRSTVVVLQCLCSNSSYFT